MLGAPCEQLELGIDEQTFNDTLLCARDLLPSARLQLTAYVDNLKARLQAQDPSAPKWSTPCTKLFQVIKCLLPIILPGSFFVIV